MACAGAGDDDDKGEVIVEVVVFNVVVVVIAGCGDVVAEILNFLVVVFALITLVVVAAVVELVVRFILEDNEVLFPFKANKPFCGESASSKRTNILCNEKCFIFEVRTENAKSRDKIFSLIPCR